MKKLLSVLLAVAMLMTCAAAFAEGTSDNDDVIVDSIVVTEADAATDTTGIASGVTPGTVINVTLDAPEGYVMTNNTANVDELYISFTPTGDETTYINLGVAYSEVFAGYTLTDPTEDEIAQMTETLSEDYNDATLEIRKTESGKTIIVINENGAESDYADIIAVQNGYFIQVSAFDDAQEVTEDDIQRSIDILDSLAVQIVPAA